MKAYGAHRMYFATPTTDTVEKLNTIRMGDVKSGVNEGLNKCQLKLMSHSEMKRGPNIFLLGLEDFLHCSTQLLCKDQQTI